jgi:hypothetical protein
MQGVGSFLVVAVALVLLYLLVSGKMDAAVATWRAAATGVAATPTPSPTAATSMAPTGSAAPTAGSGALPGIISGLAGGGAAAGGGGDALVDLLPLLA